MIIIPPVCPRCGGPTQRGKSHCVYCRSYMGESTHSPLVVYKSYESATDNGWFSPSLSLSQSLSPSPSAEASPSPSEEAPDDERTETFKQVIIEKAKKKEFLPERILRKLGF